MILGLLWSNYGVLYYLCNIGGSKDKEGYGVGNINVIEAIGILDFILEMNLGS